jgi:hypothetical protein
MILHTIERECEDCYYGYGYYIVAVYTSLEKAQAYINSQEDPTEFRLGEIEVDKDPCQ